MRKYATVGIAAILILGLSAWAEPPAPVTPQPAPQELDAKAFLETLPGLLSDESRAVETVRAFAEVQTKRADGALREARQLASTEDKTAADAHKESARQHLDAAYTAYQQLLAKYPNNVAALNACGELLYDHLRNQAEALAKWRLAASLDPTFGPVRNNLGIHYCHEGQYEQGLRYLQEALKLEPENPDYLFNMTQALLVHREPAMKFFHWNAKRLYKEAMNRSQKARDLAPTDYELAKDYAVNFFAGEEFGVEVDWKDAADAWKQVRPLAPSEVEKFYSWLNEARAAMRAKDKERARACLKEALTISPNSGPAITLLEGLDAPEKESPKAEKKSEKTKRKVKPAKPAPVLNSSVNMNRGQFTP